MVSDSVTQQQKTFSGDTFRLFKDIRFWLVFFFIIRLYGITNPPLEVGHNWRQTTVTMVARNFYEIDASPLYPRIDFAGEKTGITGMEFPILNYSIYAISEVFGYQHWYGRLLNLLVSTIGLWYFFLLIKRFFDEPTAFYATMVLTVSIWFQFSRKIMPDTFSTSLVIASIYYGTAYLQSNERKKLVGYLFASLLLLLIGVLAKLPAGFLLICYALFYFNTAISIVRKIIFAVGITLVFIPIIWWYYSWVPFLVEQFGFWHFFMGKSLKQGLIDIAEHLPLTLSRFYDTALKFIGFGVFLFGFIHALCKKQRAIYGIFLLGFVGFSLIILKAGFTFAHHNYYIIPFVPIMSLVAGYGLAQLPSKTWKTVLLIGIIVEGIANQQHDFRIKENDAALLHLEADLDLFSSQKDLIFINSGDFPTPMYFAHRKGWIGTNETLLNREKLAEMRTKGLKYVVVLKRSFGSDLELPTGKELFHSDDYRIYSLP